MPIVREDKKNIVIIGAGPVGLYFALQLVKKGVLPRNIAIYDPRAGEYTRSNQLIDKIRFEIEKELGPLEIGDTEQFEYYVSIRGIEQGLFKKARALGITIEKKSFVELAVIGDARITGVVLTDSDAKDTTYIVPADYIYDCTGSKRAIFKAITTTLDAPLKIETFLILPIQRHLIAQITISYPAFEKLDNKRKKYLENLRDNRFEAEDTWFVSSMLQLHALGWKEFRFPECYSTGYGSEGQAYFYMETPNNLGEADYEQWVKTVLECFDGSKVSYKYLGGQSFVTAAEALSKVCFQHVVALGDAQINSHFRAGHGLSISIERVHLLLKEITVLDGAINFFNPERYEEQIAVSFAEQKQALAGYARRKWQVFTNILESAKEAFIKALEACGVSDLTTDKSALMGILSEMNGRNSYRNAYGLFLNRDTTFDASASENVTQHVRMLTDLYQNLLDAYEHLPLRFADEHIEIKRMLLILANCWIVFGDKQCERRNVENARNAYKNADKIYNLPSFYFLGYYVPIQLAMYERLRALCMKLEEKCGEEESAALVNYRTYIDRNPVRR